MRHSAFVHYAIISMYIALAVAQECEDKDKNCAFWASEKECDKNPRWMLPNCQVSCRSCRQPSAGGGGGMERAPIRQDGTCPRVQVQEISTRITPDGNQYRQQAFRDGCAIPNQPNICGQNFCYHKRFRTFDGSCNNLRNPLNGAAYMPFVRLLPANYADGINQMHGLAPGSLPNPRDVTFKLISTKIALNTKANSLLMQMGQFISHDITRNTLINTCTCSTRGPQCANMPISRFDTRTARCIPLTRSIPECGTGMPPRVREQMNENTSPIDGSQVYGGDPKSAATLRVGALMRTAFFKSELFPPPAGGNGLATGDDRSNLFIGLAAFHTMFLRLHNRIATELARMNRQWNQDRVYQETRKIVGAFIQVIAYREFLPTLLGGKFNRLVPAYTGYRPDVDIGVSNEFSAAAYRLHGLIQEFYPLIDSRFRKVGDVRFVDGTGQVKNLLDFGIDVLIRGMIFTPARKPQRITSQVTELLFDVTDMSSLNIQRGRDHGLRTYNAYRQMCKLPPLRSFDDWKEVSDPAVRRRVAELYGSPDKVDLYVGGLLEEPSENSLLGETFSCIIGEQFTRTRNGDRFYFENVDIFTPSQIQSLQQVTLASVICETGEDFQRVPRNAFLLDNGTNFVPCSQIPRLSLAPWRD
jgi:peroxidase